MGSTAEAHSDAGGIGPAKSVGRCLGVLACVMVLAVSTTSLVDQSDRVVGAVFFPVGGPLVLVVLLRLVVRSRWLEVVALVVSYFLGCASVWSLCHLGVVLSLPVVWTLVLAIAIAGALVGAVALIVGRAGQSRWAAGLTVAFCVSAAACALWATCPARP